MKAKIVELSSPLDREGKTLGWASFPLPPQGLIDIAGTGYVVLGSRWQVILADDESGASEEASLFVAVATLQNAGRFQRQGAGLVAADASALDQLNAGPQRLNGHA